MDTRAAAARSVSVVGAIVSVVLAFLATDASALPIFARQTGQNCLSCHAGGQFPELTPYGRMFKMTGYTIGERVKVPLAVMGIFSYAKVASTNDTGGANDPQQTYAKNGAPVFAAGSLFIGGKVTDNIGAFAQVTYDNYNGQAAIEPTGTVPGGRWQGHSASDNQDFRYADRFIDANNDLIFGVSVNNNPSVTDPWNTAPAWMQYVPDTALGTSPAGGGTAGRSHQFADIHTPYPGFGGYAGNDLSHSTGLNAYLFWNKSIYAEVGLRRTANQAFSFMSAGIADADTTHWSGSNNPYWRFAYSHEWGAHNIMIGTTGMISHIFADPTDPNSVHRNKDVGIDAQYQYLLDPHTVTVQAAYWKNTTDASQTDVLNAINAGTPLASNSETSYTWRTKASYVYQAKYGGSISYFNTSGTTDITGNNPFLGTNGLTYEVFWLPVQYVRVGLQYTSYNRFNGATSLYDGVRNPKDNNTLLGYVWFAY